MTGQRFGRWTVLDQPPETSVKGERKWLCRCDCGTERYVLERSLRYGGSVSCGCFRKEKAKEAVSPDLSGRVFGELTAIRETEVPGKRQTYWLCQCSCGAEYVTAGTLLITGRRTRCAAKVHEKNYAYSNITGKRFGRLTALFRTKEEQSGGSALWHCRCDCGREVNVPYNSLMYSNQKSCGCQKREHEQNLKDLQTRQGGTSLEAIRSRKIPKDNTTGYRGVYLIKGKFVAKIVFQKKAYYLGAYDNIQDAAVARREAEEILFEKAAEYLTKWKQAAQNDPEWASNNPVRITVSFNVQKRLQIEFTPELIGREDGSPFDQIQENNSQRD